MADSKRILLVEDDLFTRFMMKEIIDTLGASADVAEDGSVGCAMLESNPDAYGLVLMDIHMPNFTGVEAAKRIRDHPNDPPSNIPIIAVTADEEFHSMMFVRSVGMDGFMAKPVSPGGLLGLIDQYCSAA